jgi:hypothetical protein
MRAPTSGTIEAHEQGFSILAAFFQVLCRNSLKEPW